MTSPTRRRVLTSLAGALGWSTLRRERNEETEPTRNAETETFGAWLTGANQVPPVRTDAVGFAAFRVAPDGASIDYWLVVANVEDAEESHVHKGPPDLNGNVVAYLFGPVETPVSETGLLASGTLTDDDVIWPLTDVAGMVEQMRDANVYVNVHTTEHPPGEIRGQIRPTGVLSG